MISLALILAAVKRRKRPLARIQFATLCVSLLIAAGLASCSGSGAGGGNQGTPPGTTSVSVSAGAGGTNHAAKLTITVNALVASTHLLVPIQAAYFAIEGTDDLLETYARIRSRPNPDLKVLGVVITLFDKRTNISRDTHEQIRATFGDALFKTRISKNVRLEESPAYKETVFSFAPKSSGAEDYKKLAQEVLQRVQEDRVTRHSQDAA